MAEEGSSASSDHEVPDLRTRVRAAPSAPTRFRGTQGHGQQVTGPAEPAGTMVRNIPAQRAAAEATRVRARTEPSGPTASGVSPDAPMQGAPTLFRGRSAPAKAPVEPQSSLRVQDRYVLESIIGSGAMGQIWKARDLLRERAASDRPYVALKILTRDLGDAQEAFRGLEREASRAQELAHPNIITVHTFDFDRQLNCGFIAMELLEGSDLSALIREAPTGIPMEKADALIRGMADGLAYAHSRGFVHCDLKPSNVFVTTEGVVKLLDLGISRAAPGHTTSSDGFCGYTPSYASPDIVADRAPVPADDVYALGVVAYEIVTGRHPFGGRSGEEARQAGLKPTAPRGLKRRQWRAIERALAFDRADRWPDADAFRRAWNGIGPVPKALAAALVVVIAISAGVVGFGIYEARRAHQVDIAFHDLSHELQTRIRAALEAADRDLREAESNRNVFLVQQALQQYALAYELHPKNPDATKGMRRAAVLFIETAEQVSPEDGAAAREWIRKFQDHEENVAIRRFRPLDGVADLDL